MENEITTINIHDFLTNCQSLPFQFGVKRLHYLEKCLSRIQCDFMCVLQSKKKSALDLLGLLDRILSAQNAQCSKNETCAEIKASVQVEGVPFQAASKKVKLGQHAEKNEVTPALTCTSALEIRFRIAQSKPGWLNVMASIPKESSSVDARAFSKFTSNIWGDVTMMWG